MHASILCLKEKDCQFALEAFDSGMSLSAHLKHLPVDFLKIDACCVKDNIADSVDVAMVYAIDHIGHVINLKQSPSSLRIN